MILNDYIVIRRRNDLGNRDWYPHDHQFVFLPSREHTQPCVDNSEHMQITHTTLQSCPAPQATKGNNITMRIWHTHTWCTAAVAMCYIQQ